MKPITQEEIQLKFEALRPLRWAVDRIEPDTIVVTFAQSLAAAVQHYQTLDPPLSFLPSFFLVDCENEGDLPQEASDTVAQFGVKIFFPSDIDLINTQKFCVYVVPQQYPWEEFGHNNIYHKLLEYGVISCGFDAVCEKLFPDCERLPSSKYYMQELSFIFNNLADEESRETYLRVIKARNTGDSGYLPLAEYPIYAHPLTCAQQDDYILEGGVHNGLSTERFARAIGDKGKIFAFEAFPLFAEKSREYLEKYPNVRVVAQGLYSAKKTFYMVDNSSGSYLQEEPVCGAEVVETTDIDSFVAENDIKKCDLLKLDIEGAEMECLQGAVKTLEKFKPKLHISIYHHLQHYFSIPILLMKNFPSYKFYMGHDCTWFNETILYAINEGHALTKNEVASPKSESISNFDLLYSGQKNGFAGRDVIYVGCGAAYRHYKNCCNDCNPVAIVVDQRFISDLPEHIDGIKVKTFESLSQKERELPAVLFTRDDYLLPLIERIEKEFCHSSPDNLLKYILY